MTEIELADNIESTLTAVNDKDFCDRLQQLTQHLYSVARDNPSIAKDLTVIATQIINYLNNLQHEDPTIPNRILSFVAFKYDVLLQLDTNVKTADEYFQWIKAIIATKSYKHDNFTIAKLSECMTKIQFAYNILRKIKDLRPYYVDLMRESSEQFLGMIEDINTFDHLDVHSPANMLLYYTIYRPDLPILLRENESDPLSHPYAMPVIFWKAYKKLHYNMTQEEIFAEGFETYNFIWR